MILPPPHIIVPIGDRVFVPHWFFRRPSLHFLSPPRFGKRSVQIRCWVRAAAGRPRGSARPRSLEGPRGGGQGHTARGPMDVHPYRPPPPSPLVVCPSTPPSNTRRGTPTRCAPPAQPHQIGTWALCEADPSICWEPAGSFCPVKITKRLCVVRAPGSTPARDREQPCPRPVDGRVAGPVLPPRPRWFVVNFLFFFGRHRRIKLFHAGGRLNHTPPSTTTSWSGGGPGYTPSFSSNPAAASSPSSTPGALGAALGLPPPLRSPPLRTKPRGRWLGLDHPGHVISI